MQMKIYPLIMADVVILDNGRYVYIGHAGTNSCDGKCVPRSVLAAGGYDEPTWRLLGNFCLPFFTLFFALF